MADPAPRARRRIPTMLLASVVALLAVLAMHATGQHGVGAAHHPDGPASTHHHLDDAATDDDGAADRLPGVDATPVAHHHAANEAATGQAPGEEHGHCPTCRHDTSALCAAAVLAGPGAARAPAPVLAAASARRQRPPRAASCPDPPVPRTSLPTT